MMETTLYIKNMVCNRCIKVVQEELSKLGLRVKNIKLGEVNVETTDGNMPIKKIEAILSENGFELIDDINARIIEKLKF